MSNCLKLCPKYFPPVLRACSTISRLALLCTKKFRNSRLEEEPLFQARNVLYCELQMCLVHESQKFRIWSILYTSGSLLPAFEKKLTSSVASDAVLILPNSNVRTPFNLISNRLLALFTFKHAKKGRTRSLKRRGSADAIPCCAKQQAPFETRSPLVFRKTLEMSQFRMNEI